MEDRDGLDGAVEVLGREVPEDLGPEEAIDGGGDLVWEKEFSIQSDIISLHVVDVQAAAVRTISRAQWFLINFPMEWCLRSREVEL